MGVGILGNKKQLGVRGVAGGCEGRSRTQPLYGIVNMYTEYQKHHVHIICFQLCIITLII